MGEKRERGTRGLDDDDDDDDGWMDGHFIMREFSSKELIPDDNNTKIKNRNPVSCLLGRVQLLQAQKDQT